VGDGAWRIWIDTGGTFTDALALDPEGRLHRAKVLSSGVLRARIADRDGLLQVRLDGEWSLPDGFFGGAELKQPGAHEAAGVRVRTSAGPVLELDEPGGDWAAGGNQVEIATGLEAPVLAAHVISATPLAEALPAMRLRLGTTRATNALLERRGAPAALVITAGFGDLLTIGTQQRPDLFALAIEKPPPLVEAVIEVDERLAADGAELRPLDVQSLESAAQALIDRGVESAAVALAHAYRDPCHERRAAAVLWDAGFDHVAASSDLAPVIGLLERAETAVVDAYLGPVLAGYLAGVRRAVGTSQVHLMTSAGGLAEASAFRAVDALLSGPAGGVMGAAAAARRSGCERILALDMGGTSTDVSRWAGDAEVVFEHRVGDARLVAPALAIETVAAGGSSVCQVVAGQLRVGPASAGADPGPAAYGAGGPLTLTDVNLLLGRVVPERFGIPVDAQASRDALERLRSDLRAAEATAAAGDEELLEGLLAIANERMAGAMRRISVRRGFDPADHDLVAFGGAGPQHACAVARLLGMRRVLVPVDASLLSAFGMGHAVIERFAPLQVLRPLAEVEQEIGDLAADLARQAMAELVAEGVDPSGIVVRRRLAFLRLAGQDAALEVDWEPGVDLAEAFATAYRALYGYEPPARAIELESLRVVASTVADAIRPAAQPEPREAAVSGTVRTWLGGRWRSVPLVDRAEQAPGATIEGPALVVEAHSTSVVEPGWTCAVDGAGALVLHRGEDGA
jgi:5-oxoprolinase (ATP-hydrolysing)